MRSSKKFIALFMTIMILVLCTVVLVACNNKDDHEHVWEEISNSATCTAAGERVSKCTVCGEEKREASEALDHDWDEENIEVIEPATCTAEGSGVASCKRCTEKKNVVIEKIAHNITKPDFNKTRAATCTKEGLIAGTCKMCQEYVEVKLDALGHQFLGSSVVKQVATCEQEGIREISCSRNGCDGDENGNIPAVEVIKSPALGHDWQESTTLDIEPSFTAEGSRAVHCNRCEKTLSEEVVPKLEAGKPTTYRFRIARANRESLKVGLSEVNITIKDASGKIVETSNNNNFNRVNATMTVELEPANYTVELSGLPDGYSADASYSISPGSVDKDLTVHASLLPAAQASASTHYTTGSVLHDYTFKDVRGREVKLSELLASKKIVLLNFFFVTCGACQSEMPGLVSAYNIYKEDMAVVMLDCVPYDTYDKILHDFMQPFNVPFEWYAAQDLTPTGGRDEDYNNICEKFGFNNAPQNVIVDQEGVVLYAEGGSTSEMQFRNIFKKYTSAPYSNVATSSSTSPEQEQTNLPIRFDADLPRKDSASRKEEN